MTNLLKKQMGGVNALYAKSMGKYFQVMGLFLNDEDANAFTERNKDTGVIACYGNIIVVADLYESKPVLTYDTNITKRARQAGLLSTSHNG